MWPYWVMFAFPAVMALQEKAINPYTTRSFQRTGRVVIPSGWRVLMIALVLLIGWRHQVGGDWYNYLATFELAIDARGEPDWWWNDPGYRLLEWIAIKFGGGIYTVNILAASFFSYGLILFCRHLPRPWLALAVSVPYLVIILGMGYTRQGIALGCIMAGLVSLGSGNVRSFIVWTVIGATFHKSAMLVLPMAALSASRRRLVTAAWVAIIVAGSYVLLLQDSADALRANYVETGMASQGAIIRLIMNALPASLLLYKIKDFAVTLPQERLWFWFSITSILFVSIYFVTSASTALDRVGLYLLPLQLMVFSYLPEVFGGKGRKKVKYWIYLILIYYVAVEFVWLNYAENAPQWIPYQFYLYSNN